MGAVRFDGHWSLIAFSSTMEKETKQIRPTPTTTSLLDLAHQHSTYTQQPWLPLQQNSLSSFSALVIFPLHLYALFL